MALRSVTVKSAGGDYSSLNAAYVGELGNLVSLDRQLRIDCSAFNDTASASTGGGWTTDATHFITIQAVDNHNGVLSTGASSYLNSGGSLNVGASNTVIVGLSVTSLTAIIDAFGASNVRAERCIGRTNGTGWIAFSGDALFVNCLAICGPSTNGFASDGGTVTCDNCDAIGASVGFLPSGGTMVATNCLAVNCSTGFGAGTWTGSSNCASTDATIPTSGSGHRANQAILLNGPATGDYSLDASDAGAKGYGTDLSADPTFPFAIDITGAARTVPWDIGAFLPTGTASFGYLLEYVRLILEDGSGAYATEDASGALLNEISAISDTADRLILEDSSGILSLESQPITGTGSIAVALSLSGTALRGNTSTGSVAVAASLAGSAKQQHTSTGNVTVALTLSGTAKQQHTSTGSVSVALTESGTAKQRHTSTGTVAVALSLSGTGKQQHTSSGSVTLPLTLSGTAIRGNLATGSAAVSVTLSGSAKQRHTSTGSVSVPFTLAGQALRGNLATGSTSVSLSLSGSAQQRHTSTGALTVGLTLAGQAIRGNLATGSASVALAIAGSAQQQHTSTGTAALTFALSGSGTVTGSAATGAITLALALAGSATQQHAGSGSASVAVSLSGSAQQQHASTGDVDVALSLAGSASVSSGNITGTGSVDVAFSLAGTAQNTSTAIGPVDGGVVHRGVIRRPKKTEPKHDPAPPIESIGTMAVGFRLAGRCEAVAPAVAPIDPPSEITPPATPAIAAVVVPPIVDAVAPTVELADATTVAPIASPATIGVSPRDPQSISSRGAIAFRLTLAGTGAQTVDAPLDDAPSATDVHDEPPESPPIVVRTEPTRPRITPTVSVQQEPPSIVAPVFNTPFVAQQWTASGKISVGFTLSGYGEVWSPEIQDASDDDMAVVAALYYGML